MTSKKGRGQNSTHFLLGKERERARHTKDGEREQERESRERGGIRKRGEKTKKTRQRERPFLLLLWVE